MVGFSSSLGFHVGYRSPDRSPDRPSSQRRLNRSGIDIGPEDETNGGESAEGEMGEYHVGLPLSFLPLGRLLLSQPGVAQRFLISGGERIGLVR